MFTFRRVLCLLLAASGVAWLVLRWVESLYREEENYSRVEEGLYQGGYGASPPPGTTAVLNLCEHEDRFRAEVHRWEPIRDAAPAPDLGWLRQMVEFVDAQRRAGRTTFVHCRNGVSRSGMVVVAYVMFKNGWGRDRALQFVRSKRPLTRPNPAFMDLLAGWEQALKEAPAPP
jgi:hypothetical protein